MGANIMMKINVCLNIWGKAGGAERGYERLSNALNQYQWSFTTKVDDTADIVLYSNDHKFYEQAKMLNKPTIFRLTGPRSYNLPQPDDLKYVVCSSQKSYDLSSHARKVKILNGIDFDSLKDIKPIKCDLLYGPARIGRTQKVELAIKWAIDNNRTLTVTGARQHVAEDIEGQLKAKYPNVKWTGLIDEKTMLRYIAGCKSAIMPASGHGLSNFVIESIAFNKPIVNLGKVEVPRKEDIDLKNTAQQYDKLFQSILNT